MAKPKSRSSRPGQGSRSVVGVVRKAKRTVSGAGSNGTVAKSTSVTPYQERLYALCKCIPAGKVATYGTLSAVLNSAPRAVGQVSLCLVWVMLGCVREQLRLFADIQQVHLESGPRRMLPVCWVASHPEKPKLFAWLHLWS